jgi:hypothetical protein
MAQHAVMVGHPSPLRQAKNISRRLRAGDFPRRTPDNKYLQISFIFFRRVIYSAQ